MSKYTDLEVLEDLRQKGAISEEEYQREKQRILDSIGFPRNNINYNSFCKSIKWRILEIPANNSFFHIIVSDHDRNYSCYRYY